MFWKFMRWGGTLIVMSLMLAAALLAGNTEESATPVVPVDAQMQSTKNFNLQ